MYQLQMGYSKKQSSYNINQSKFRQSGNSRQLLTNTCKLYLSKYQQIKRDINIKSQYIQQMKNKKTILERKTQSGNMDNKYMNYKLQMVNNKQNIQQFFNVYKEEHGEQLELLQERQKLQIKLAQLFDQQRTTKKKIQKIEQRTKQSKQSNRFNLKNIKYQQRLKDIRLKIIQKELQINQMCNNKKLKNLRYYICQFGKQYELKVVQDLAICKDHKVQTFSIYIKNQPIFISLKRQIGQFLDLYLLLEGIFDQKPKLPCEIQSLQNDQDKLKHELKQIQGNIQQIKSHLQKKTLQIEQLTNKQIKVNLKNILEQNQNNPDNLRKEAKLVAIQQRKRVNSVKEKLGEIRQIENNLKNLKSVQNNRKCILEERDSLSRIIGIEQSKLRNKIQKKDQIQECLDNIITDRNAFKDKSNLKTKKLSMIDLYSQSPKPQPTFRNNTYLLRGSSSQKTLPQFQKISLISTALNSDNISRQSRLVSLNQSQKRLPITHSLNKKSMQDLIMSRIAKKTGKF